MSGDTLDFAGKRVLVTGGSDGIGYCTAKCFLSRGAEVVVTGTKSPQDYDNDFAGMSFHSLNVCDSSSVTSLAEQYSELDVLVNSVGTVLYASREYERHGFEHVITVNLTGVMHLCSAFKSSLRARSGVIINVDSAVARQVAPGNPAYSASKAGLVHLTSALAVRWGRFGIRVNGIGPGLIPTKLTANQVSEVSEPHLCSVAPLGRLGKPEDVAGVALFLASPLAAYITGQSILVDGGLTLVSAFAQR